jgi:hypothetical protein
MVEAMISTQEGKRMGKRGRPPKLTGGELLAIDSRRKAGLVELPEEKVQSMFAHYCQVPTFSYVARVCHVSPATVRRYWEEGNWDERREGIINEARHKADFDMVSATTKSLAILQRAKEKLEEKLHGLDPKDMNPAFLVSDIERVVKLEQMLLGGVGERKEMIYTSHEERIRKLRESREKDVTPRPRELTI